MGNRNRQEDVGGFIPHKRQRGPRNGRGKSRSFNNSDQPSKAPKLFSVHRDAPPLNAARDIISVLNIDLEAQADLVTKVSTMDPDKLRKIMTPILHKSPLRLNEFMASGEFQQVIASA